MKDFELKIKPALNSFISNLDEEKTDTISECLKNNDYLSIVRITGIHLPIISHENSIITFSYEDDKVIKVAYSEYGIEYCLNEKKLYVNISDDLRNHICKLYESKKGWSLFEKSFPIAEKDKNEKLNKEILKIYNQFLESNIRLKSIVIQEDDFYQDGLEFAAGEFNPIFPMYNYDNLRFNKDGKLIIINFGNYRVINEQPDN